MAEDLTKKVIDFFKKGDKIILSGTVFLQGRIIATPQQRVTQLTSPLYFEPPLDSTREINDKALQVLLQYLQRFQPITRRGLTFSPSANFSVHRGDYYQTLFMQGDENCSPGEAIDVFDLSLAPDEFETIISLIKQRKVSGFVIGRLLERVDYSSHVLLRRYFSE